MDKRYFFSESGVKSGHILVSQGNLRDKEDHLSPSFQNMADKFHVNLGFPAAGNTFDQTWPGNIRLPFFQDILHCLLLFLTEKCLFFRRNPSWKRRSVVSLS